MAGNPWDNDAIVGSVDPAPALGRPVIRKGVEPSKPDLPTGWEIGPDGTARPIAGLPKGFTDPKTDKPDQGSLPKGWRMNPNTGQAEPIPGLPKSLVAGDGGSAEAIAKQQNIDAADSLIRGVQRARGFINDANVPIIGNTATGAGYSIMHHVPATDASKLKAVIEQEIRGNIFLKRIADLREANDSPNGGTGIGRIMQSEIPLITGAIGSLDPAALGKDETLKSLAQIERSALRSKAIFNGENPDDPAVQQKYGIAPLVGTSAQPPADNSAPPPPAAGAALGAPPAPVNPIANGGGGQSDPTLAPSTDGYKSVIDPKKQALGAKIVALMSKGADKNTIMGFAVGADPTLRNDPEFRGWVDQAIQYRQKYPKAQFPISPEFYTTKVPLGRVEGDMTAMAQTPGGAATINAGNALLAGNMNKLVGDEAAQRALAVAQTQHPNASLAGTMGGGALASLGGELALGKLGMEAGAGRQLLADSGYGAAAGGSNGGGVTGAGKGVLAAFLGNRAGNMVGTGVGKAISGVTNPTVSYVSREIPGALTVGQALSQSGRVGPIIKKAEDSLSGIRVLGDTINARRLEGLQRMNSKAFDRALEPIGETVKGQFGEQAVADAQDKVSQAFSKALSGKTAGLDRGFITDATKAKMSLDRLPDSVRGDVNKLIDNAVNDHFDDSGNITGEGMQSLLRELGNIKRSYQGTPAGHSIGQVVDQFTNSVEGLFKRQAPDVMPAYNAAKQSYRRLNVLADAVNRAKNETDGKTQVFTTGQLGLADRANAVKFNGKIAAAGGSGEFHDFHKNMQAVLPNKVPDSGTAGRLILPLAAIGAGGGVGALGDDTKTGLTLGALLSLAYTKAGQRALTGALLKRGNAARAAGAAVRKGAPLLGHATGSAAALGSSSND